MRSPNRVQRQKGMILRHVFFHDGTTRAGEVAFLSGYAISATASNTRGAAHASRLDTPRVLPDYGLMFG